MTTLRFFTVTLMSGPQDGLQLRFPAPLVGDELVLTIGRSDTCDIALTYDGQVSRTHAQLICLHSDDTLVEGSEESLRLAFRLKDNGSRNGTYIGERRFHDETADLKRGELFRVGRTWLRVD